MTGAPAIVIVDRSSDPRVADVLQMLEARFERPCGLTDDHEWLPGGNGGPGEAVAARDLLEAMTVEAAQRTETWWLAIVSRDLRPSTGSAEWAFGEALVGEGCAVVSTRRLRAHDDGVFTRRLAGECIHELGHAAGLEHCSNAGCVMRQARDLEEVDRRPDSFCPACAAALRALDNGRGG